MLCYIKAIENELENKISGLFSMITQSAERKKVFQSFEFSDVFQQLNKFSSRN